MPLNLYLSSPPPSQSSHRYMSWTQHSVQFDHGSLIYSSLLLSICTSERLSTLSNRSQWESINSVTSTWPCHARRQTAVLSQLLQTGLTNKTKSATVFLSCRVVSAFQDQEVVMVLSTRTLKPAWLLRRPRKKCRLTLSSFRPLWFEQLFSFILSLFSFRRNNNNYNNNQHPSAYQLIIITTTTPNDPRTATTKTMKK